MRWWRVLLVAATLSFVGVGVAAAAPSANIPGPIPIVGGLNLPIPGAPTCRHTPTSESPNSGWGTVADGGPSQPVPDQSPFEPHAKVSIYQVYGYGGGFYDYDPGCNPLSTLAINTWLANLWVNLTSFGIGVTVAISRFVFNPGFLSFLAPLQSVMREVIGVRIVVPLIGFAVAGTGLWMLTRAARAKISQTANQAGWAFLIVTAAAATIFYPVSIGAQVDSAMSGAVAAVSTSLQGTSQMPVPDAIASNLQRSLIYGPWLQGMFGPNKEAAGKYGPLLWANSHLSRAEQDKIDKDPSTYNDIQDEHRSGFDKAASDLKDEYPDAYDYLAGNHDGARGAYAFVGALGCVFGCVLFIIAMLMILRGLIAARVCIGLVPAAALVAHFPRFRWVMLDLLGYVVTSLATGLAAGCISIVYIVGALGGILSPDSSLNPFQAVLALGGLNAVLVGLWWKFGRRSKRKADLHGLRDRLRKKWGDRGDDESAPGQQSQPYRISNPGAKVPVSAQVRQTAVRFGAQAIGAAVAGGVGAAVGGAAAAAAIGPKQPTETDVPFYRVVPKTQTVSNLPALPAATTPVVPETHQVGAAPAARGAISPVPNSPRVRPVTESTEPVAPSRVYHPSDNAGPRASHAPVATSADGTEVHTIYTPTPVGAAR